MNQEVWATPLAVFTPSLLVIGFGVWGIRAVLSGMKEMSSQILTWHGSQESLEAHEKMFRKFIESDFFRDKLNDHVTVKIDTAISPLNLKMDLLDRNVQIATSNLGKEMREEMRQFKAEVLIALASRPHSESSEESAR